MRVAKEEDPKKSGTSKQENTWSLAALKAIIVEPNFMDADNDHNVFYYQTSSICTYYGSFCEPV